MANKQLAYPAENIDYRLGTAHIHTNLDALNTLTPEDISDIAAISDKLSVDMSNVDLTALADAVIDAGVAFEDAPENNQLYARRDGSWVNINNIYNSTTGTSSTLDVTNSDKVITINLKSSTQAQLNSIAGKLDKLQTYVPDDLILADSLGGVYDSGIAKSDIITKTTLNHNVTVGGRDTAPSSAVTKELYDMVSGVSGGIGQTRGSVYSALSAAGVTNVYTIPTDATISIVNGGTGYIEGSIVGYSGVVDATFLITSVDDSAGADNRVTGISLINGGMFDFAISGDTPISLYGGGVDATGLTISVTAQTTAPSTLYTISDPVKNDTAYVMKDELHVKDGVPLKSIWMYTEAGDSGELGWVWLTSFTDETRDFLIEPLRTEELQNGAVTSAKLYSIPPRSILANLTTSSAPPTDVSVDELAFLVGGVSGVKGANEALYRAGQVNITPENIGWSPHNIKPVGGTTSYLSVDVEEVTDGDLVNYTVNLDLSQKTKDMLAAAGSGNISVNPDYFVFLDDGTSSVLNFAKEGLKVISDAGITDSYGDGVHYPRSLTPPLLSADDTIATTAYVRNKILEDKYSESGSTESFPFLTAGYYTVQLYEGTWKLECWGASGGGEVPEGVTKIYRNEYTDRELVDVTPGTLGAMMGGGGGYASAEFEVTGSDAVTVYIVVGGTTQDTNGGFNGGGSSSSYYGPGGICTGYGGGGATHIALRSGVLSDLENNRDSILLVAGGGGGAYAGTDTTGSASSTPPSRNTPKICWGTGGYGGGEVGGEGNGVTGGGGGYGGSQSAGGATISESQTGEGRYNPTAGSFGRGGNGNTISQVGYSANNGGGGGGGYYGGGGASPIAPYHAGYHTDHCFKGGGGGSGFVNQGALSNSNITFVSGTADLRAGNTLLPNPSDLEDSGMSFEEGHFGDGLVRITYKA